MDKSAALTTLNLRLGDTNNFTFTSDEKNQVLDEAFNDDHVFSTVWDDSLTYDQSVYQYAKPTDVDVVQDICIRPDNTTATEPESIASSLWEVIDSNIHFKNGANRAIPHGYTLFIKGKNKYTTSDTITETNVQEYVLNLAQLKCLKMLGVKKSLSFLKNDTSMGEIIALKLALERDVQEYRRKLPKSFEVA